MSLATRATCAAPWTPITFAALVRLVLAGAYDQVSERRVDAVIETLLHGVIAPVATRGAASRPRSPRRTA